jgi:hypothetical protein
VIGLLIVWTCWRVCACVKSVMEGFDRLLTRKQDKNLEVDTGRLN